MLLQEDIILQLEKMGAPKDKIVIVHASLKAVGEVQGRAQGLLDALVKYFTAEGGVLCVPAHTWKNFYSGKEYALDETCTKTCIGTLGDVAVADPRSLRTSGNPTHSLSLFGKKDKIEKLARLEEQVNTPTSPLGCYGKIIEEGFVLLIGVGQDKNTTMHCVEEMMSIPNRLKNQPAKMKILTKDKTVKEKEFYYMYTEGDIDVSLRFPKYEIAFRKQGAIVDGMIGNAKVQLCNAQTIKRVMFEINKKSKGAELLCDDIPLSPAWYK